MKKYSNYKYSGVEWIGDIPKHWKVRKLKYIIEIKNGYAFNSSDYVENGKYPIIRIGDIAKDINFENCKYIDIDIDECKDFIIQYNDILVALTGATIGKNTIYKYGYKALLNQRVAILRSDKLNQIFLKHFVDSYLFKKYIDYDCIGGAQENIGKENIGNFYIFIPTVKEQQQIANYLDKKTSKIDEIINDKEELIKLLEEKKEIIISNAVTKGLNPDVKMKDSGVEWIGDIPKHWEVRKLKYIFKLITEKSNLELPKIGLENIESNTGNFIETKTIFDGDGICFKINDILFGKLRPYLSKVYLATFEGKAIGDFFILRTSQKIIGQYAQKLLISKNFINIINDSTHGARMPRVSWDFMSNLQLALPPKQEQQQIVDFLDKKTDEITQTIQTIKDEIKLLKEYKEILIYEVVTGKIDVRSGDEVN